MCNDSIEPIDMCTDNRLFGSIINIRVRYIINILISLWHADHQWIESLLQHEFDTSQACSLPSSIIVKQNNQLLCVSTQQLNMFCCQ